MTELFSVYFIVGIVLAIPLLFLVYSNAFNAYFYDKQKEYPTDMKKVMFIAFVVLLWPLFLYENVTYQGDNNG